MIVETAAEALLHPLRERAATGALPAGFRRLPASDRGQHQQRPSEHHQETADADNGDTGELYRQGGHAEHEQGDAEQEQGDALYAPAAGWAAQASAAHSRCELRVL